MTLLTEWFRVAGLKLLSRKVTCVFMTAFAHEAVAQSLIQWIEESGNAPWGCQQYTYCWYVALYTISYAAIHLCICLLYNIRMIDCVDYMMQKKGLPLRKLSASKAFHLSF